MPNVSFGPHFDSFVQEQVESGRYNNVSEVVRAGLRLLEDQEGPKARTARLRREINDAFDDPSESIPAEDVLDRLTARHEARAKAARRGA
jgi:antitoxin ParD1/3/4